MKNKRLLAGPYLFWSVSFVVIPLLVIVYYAFTSDEGSFTFSNLAQITTPENLKALGMSILLSFLSTAICLILAYPLAMILSQKQVNQTSFIVLVFILPMWMNFLLRTLAWQTLLEKNGVINSVLSFLHLPALTTFVISDLLGGGKILLIGNVIEQSFKQNSNWHVGSGLSLVLMVFIIASMALVAKYDNEDGGAAF